MLDLTGGEEGRMKARWRKERSIYRLSMLYNGTAVLPVDFQTLFLLVSKVASRPEPVLSWLLRRSGAVVVVCGEMLGVGRDAKKVPSMRHSD